MDTQTDKQAYRPTDIQTHKETDMQTHTHRHKMNKCNIKANMIISNKQMQSQAKKAKKSIT